MSGKKQSYAILKTPKGQTLVGVGPFEELEECPHAGVAFYKNNFALDEPRPWKVPQEVFELSATDFESFTRPTFDWADLAPDGFTGVFSEINEAIQRGSVEKSVPVATEFGQRVSGDMLGLLRDLHRSGDHFYAYAWVENGDGFCGYTPELLFHLRKGRFKTMALAGTARSDERSIFAFDEKEIREHEYVAQTLVDSLSDLGMVKRSERQMMDLGNIVHFHTPIEIFMYGDYSIDFLLKKMHPTPALGPLPRNAETLQSLYQWRERLQAPAHFGAPFGVYQQGEFHAVVTIRGAYWHGDTVAVPAGCGVIEASRLTNEWRELAMKRNAVKASFGL